MLTLTLKISKSNGARSIFLFEFESRLEGCACFFVGAAVIDDFGALAAGATACFVDDFGALAGGALAGALAAGAGALTGALAWAANSFASFNNFVC